MTAAGRQASGVFRRLPPRGALRSQCDAASVRRSLRATRSQCDEPVGRDVGLRRSTGFCGSEPALCEGVAAARLGDVLTVGEKVGAALGAALGVPVLVAVATPDAPETVGTGDTTLLGPVLDAQDDSTNTVAAITASEASPLARTPLMAHPPRRLDAPWRALVTAHSDAARSGSPELSFSAIAQLDDPAGRCGVGDQCELIGLGYAVEQPGPLARYVREHAHVKFVDQVELHERAKQPHPAPDQDVPVAALPELVDFLGRVPGG